MKCQATTKDGRPCGRNAVKGLTVCAAHAERPALTNNADHAEGDSPPSQEAGTYAPGVGEEELATLAEIRRLGADLTEELALARLQLLRALERSRDETREACDGKRCPLGLVDKRLELVAKVAERCSRIAEGLEVRVVDPAAIDHVLTIIRKHIPNPETLKALAEELGGG
ncbi:MAG: hypothetical protein JXA57_19205 [Armatimonadetes bacterium]|nr:hypothetical protein [Armatimonadota bacterium]